MEKIKKFLSFAETFIITLFAVALIYTYIFRIFTVHGDSMRETLESEDKVLACMLYGDLNQGDIIVAYADGIGTNIVKRVIAVGGQTIDIDFGSGAVYIDGERYFENYLTLGLTHKNEGAFEYPVTVPENCVFVMGDYRAVSEDSRSENIGFIPEKNILGKVLLRISPFDKFGTLEQEE